MYILLAEKILSAFMTEFCLVRKEANLMTLRSRYNNMYIPSDFFNASFLWTDVFPAHRPFTLGNSCDFHIFPKSVTPPTKLDSILDPLDADYRFNVKVMVAKMSYSWH